MVDMSSLFRNAFAAPPTTDFQSSSDVGVERDNFRRRDRFSSPRRLPNKNKPSVFATPCFSFLSILIWVSIPPTLVRSTLPVSISDSPPPPTGSNAIRVPDSIEPVLLPCLFWRAFTSHFPFSFRR
jgi:hypothetical protein